MCVYVCIGACVYVCICIYVCLFICMHIHLYTHACGCTYALLQVFLNTCMRVWGGLELEVFSACSLLALVAGVGGYVFVGVEIGVLSCTFLSFCGC